MTMATTTAPRSKKTTARKPSSRKTSSPRKAAPSRAKQTQGARRPQAERAILQQKSRSGNLPGWDALGGRSARGKKTKASRRVRALDATPSLKLGLLLLFACVLVTAFVGHTFATQATLADVQQARAENQRLRLTNQRLRGAFDRMTGPEAVMPRAAALGLDEGIAYGPSITLD
ncbi:hypothetical protein BSZ36_14595 [Rubricoccus marinus]|uniref:Cell division protein FtsL n=2 Tax=Rubricoccus marinus TaxID=716817 RepID=A0A259U297_9BACT|nr:hypothetical protein BSZ36_14595 [Rubricoccus marinus]